MWATHLRGFARRQPLGLVGACLVIAVLVAAAFAPVLAPSDPGDIRVSSVFVPPGIDFLLGTDKLGRDLLSRILYGARVALIVGFGSVFFGVTAGTVVGILSGYLKGRFDLTVQRCVDAAMALPTLVLALIMAAVLGPSTLNVAIAVGLVMIPHAVRVLRSSALGVSNETYVEAARATGCTLWRILFRHIAPQCIAPYIVLATVQIGWAIVTEASLSFLGLGTPPDVPSWGGTLSIASREFLERAPWVAIFPGVAITLTVFGFNLLGDSLRDVLDPRLRGS
ncbi:MAG: ABC transporter permease [Chloroflexi bacterium]|nr:ABC transporter permease [Chloroflexota bacterium]